MKVGADLMDDLRRGKLIRSIIDDSQWQRQRCPQPDDPELAGKNAGPTGAVLMIDANQVWDVQQAIDYVSSLAEIKPWCVCAQATLSSYHSTLLGAEGEGEGVEVLRNEKLTGSLCACARVHLVLGSSRSRRRRTISLDTRPFVAR
jgi:hypothetical protein